MLDPKTDYIDYGKLLMPPDGFILSKAIGTTYCLDLEALLAIPVALFYSKPIRTDFEDYENPLDVFESVSNAASRITVFCQKGKIKVPKNFNKLLSFTENCIVEIKPSNAFSSFHPKVWCLWFRKENSNEKIVRFAVLSRNLTFDRSWDISFCFEGGVTSEKQIKNNPIIDFLSYLEKKSNIKIDTKFIRDLERTKFISELPIKSWTFHPIGINEKYNNPLAEDNFRPEELLLMSPFVDDESIIKTSRLASICWLFSRKIDLQKLSQASYSNLAKSFHVSNSIVDGELKDNTGDANSKTEPDSLDLHAKLYISKKRGHFTWLFGSANLSKPAFGRNIECLFEFSTDDNRYSPFSIYEELVSTEKENKLFEEFIFKPLAEKHIESDISQKIRNLEFGIINCPFTGVIIPDELKVYYKYEMNFDASKLYIPDGFRVTLQIVNFPSTYDSPEIKINLNNKLLFTDLLKESQLTKYFIINIFFNSKSERSFVLKADIDLPETRFSKITSELIDSTDKFMKYLRMLLSENGIVDDTGLSKEIRSANPIDNSLPIWEKYRFPLFEELLKAAAHHPGKIKRINETVTKLRADKESEGILSPEFLQLWEVFNKYKG